MPRNTITVTKLYEHSGPAADDYRRERREKAQALADKHSTTVELRSRGGIVLDAFEPSELGFHQDLED